MSCLRVRFARTEQARFISHLDIMRAFERAIRRAGLPIEYSKGFNPRPGIIFGLPLPVGVTSEAEYADFKMRGDIPPEEFLEGLGPQMPPGLELDDAESIFDTRNIMASVEAALYDAELFSRDECLFEHLKNVLERLMDLNEIIVEKKTKRGMKSVDIRPLLLKVELGGSRGIRCNDTQTGNNSYRAVLTMMVSAGSRNNLNPELFLTEIKRNPELEIVSGRLHRRELYISRGEKLVPPFEK